MSVAAIRTSFLAASGIPLSPGHSSASSWDCSRSRRPRLRGPRTPTGPSTGARPGLCGARSAPTAPSAGRRPLAGAVNALAREHRSLVAQAMAGAEAALSDGKRQGHLYRRSHQHGLPEPAAGLCYPQRVTQADLPRPVTELLATYPDVGPGSHLAALATVSLDDLDQSWTDLQQQLRVQAEARQSGEQPAGHRRPWRDPARPATPRPGTARGRPPTGTGRSPRPVRHERPPDHGVDLRVSGPLLGRPRAGAAEASKVRPGHRGQLRPIPLRTWPGPRCRSSGSGSGARPSCSPSTIRGQSRARTAPTGPGAERRLPVRPGSHAPLRRRTGGGRPLG